MRSTMAASVVDLPEPVTPVTRISPRGMSQNLLDDLRQIEFVEGANLGGDDAQYQSHVAALLEDVHTEAAQSGDAVAIVSISVVSLNFCFWRADIMLNAIVSMSLALTRGWSVSGIRSPVDAQMGIVSQPSGTGSAAHRCVTGHQCSSRHPEAVLSVSVSVLGGISRFVANEKSPQTEFDFRALPLHDELNRYLTQDDRSTGFCWYFSYAIRLNASQLPIVLGTTSAYAH